MKTNEGYEELPEEAKMVNGCVIIIAVILAIVAGLFSFLC